MNRDEELVVELLDGRSFVVRTPRTLRPGRETVDDAHAMVSFGALEDHGDGTWTLHAPALIRSVTCRRRGGGPPTTR